MGFFKRIIDSISCRKWCYTFLGSYIRVQHSGKMSVGKCVSIRNSKIFVDENSSLTICDGARIDNADIYVKGVMQVGVHSIIGANKDAQITITIEDGSMAIGHHSKISCKRVWIRFGGKTSIGDYTNLNVGGELRCDEAVTIGDYDMISYNVNIWDTNTHTIYPPKMRREITEKYWPYFGKEIERPKTSPVCIGNDVWIGENVSILKGTELGDNVIVGYGTSLVNKKIEPGRSVVKETNVRFF